MGLSGRSAQGGRMMVCRFTRSVKGNPLSCFVLLSPLGCVMLKLVGVPRRVFSKEESNGTPTPC
jgi:hypothetical protein